MTRSRFGAVALATALSCLVVSEAAGQAAGGEDIAFRLGGIEFLGDGPNTLGFGAGFFDVLQIDERDHPAAELRLDYRWGGKWLALGPTAGVLVNSDGGVFGYAGIYSDLRLAERWIITPSIAIGAYGRGAGKALGGVFEIQSGVDLAYRLESGDRFGLKFVHISNAGLYDANPGSESLLLVYTMQFGDSGR